MPGFDGQTSIDTAASARCVETAETEYQVQFKNLIKNSYEVPNILSPDQETLLKKIAKVPFVTSKTKHPVTNDHPVLYSLRELIRQDYAKNFRIDALGAATLVVGSAYRETVIYREHQNFDFYFHMTDAKDVSRTVLPLLEGVIRSAKKKINESPALKKQFSRTYQDREEKPVFNLYENFSELLEHYRGLEVNAGRFHSHVLPRSSYNVLLFEDTLYNFDEDLIVETFKKTGASVAYGYMLLPEEFHFPGFMHNPLFSLKTEGDYTKMSYKGGYCNGYVHKTKSWRLLADTLGISTPRFNLLFEINSRIGPYVTFTIQRTSAALNEHRVFSLAPEKQYVNVLNIVETKALADKGVHRYEFFPVLATEFYAAHNYFFVLKAASLTVENLGSFVRHRMTGASLVNKELLPEWMLSDNFFTAFIVALHIHVVNRRKFCADLIERYTDDSWATWAAHLLGGLASALCKRSALLSFIASVLTSESRLEVFVRYPKTEVEQNFSCGPKAEQSLTARIVGDTSEVNDKCIFCTKMAGKLGAQKVMCDYKTCQRTFSMSQAQIDWLKARTLKDPGDGAVEKDEKEDIAKTVPKTPFSYTCEVQLIDGGPGTGKTDYICTWADATTTLCIGPFKFLMADYENFTSRGGEKKEFTFKTFQHKGLKVKTQFRTLVVDEFTAVSYEHLAATVFNTKPDLVVFLGDPKQCLINPEHGAAIENHLDLDDLSRHTLLVNFRNPMDVVAILNMHLGYRLETKSERFRSIEWCDADDVARLYPTAKKMFFTDDAREKYDNASACVPSHQGQTYSKTEADPPVVLFVTKYDRPMIKSERPVRVGLSRHKVKLVIACDDSKVAQKFREKYTLTDEQIRANLPQVSVEKAAGRAFGELDVSFVHNGAVKDAVKKNAEILTREAYHTRHHGIVTGDDLKACPAGFLIEGAECQTCAAYEFYAVNERKSLADAYKLPEPVDDASVAHSIADRLSEVMRQKLDSLAARSQGFSRLKTLVEGALTAYAEVKDSEGFRLASRFLLVAAEVVVAWKAVGKVLNPLKMMCKVVKTFGLTSLKALFVHKSLDDGLSRLFSTSAGVLSGFSASKLVATLCARALLRYSNPLVDFFNFLCTCYSLPSEFLVGQVVNLVYSVYVGYSVFSVKKIEALAAVSARLHGYSDYDTGPKAGYCWTEAFHPSWRPVLQAAFPPGLGNGQLMVLYAAAIVAGKNETKIDYYVSHIGRSATRKCKWDLLRAFAVGRPLYDDATYSFGIEKTALLAQIRVEALEVKSRLRKTEFDDTPCAFYYSGGSVEITQALKSMDASPAPLVKRPRTSKLLAGVAPLRVAGANADGSLLKAFFVYNNTPYHCSVDGEILSIVSTDAIGEKREQDGTYVREVNVGFLSGFFHSPFSAFVQFSKLFVLFVSNVFFR